MSRPVNHKAAPLFSLARAKLLQNVDYFPSENGGPTCDGLDSEEERDIFLSNCTEERREKREERILLKSVSNQKNTPDDFS